MLGDTVGALAELREIFGITGHVLPMSTVPIGRAQAPSRSRSTSVRAGTVRHVGLPESLHMLATKLGWHLDRSDDQIEAIDGQHVSALGERGSRQAMDRAATRDVTLSLRRRGAPHEVIVRSDAVYPARKP